MNHTEYRDLKAGEEILEGDEYLMGFGDGWIPVDRASIGRFVGRGSVGCFRRKTPAAEHPLPPGVYPPGFIKDTTKALPSSEFRRYGEALLPDPTKADSIPLSAVGKLLGRTRAEQLSDTEGAAPKTEVKEPRGFSLDALERSLHEHFDAAQKVGEMSWNDDVPYIKGVISNVIEDFRAKPTPPEPSGSPETRKARRDTFLKTGQMAARQVVDAEVCEKIERERNEALRTVSEQAEDIANIAKKLGVERSYSESQTAKLLIATTALETIADSHDSPDNDETARVALAALAPPTNGPKV